jgi:hypothetical protein
MPSCTGVARRAAVIVSSGILTRLCSSTSFVGCCPLFNWPPLGPVSGSGAKAIFFQARLCCCPLFLLSSFSVSSCVCSLPFEDSHGWIDQTLDPFCFAPVDQSAHCVCPPRVLASYLHGFIPPWLVWRTPSLHTTAGSFVRSSLSPVLPALVS